MDKTQFHQGSRLKYLIDRSRFSIIEISQKANIPRTSLYDFFKKEEILPSKIKALLDAMEITTDDFHNMRNEVIEKDLPYVLKAENEALKREIELLKHQLADKEEIIQLLKNKSK